MLLVRVKLTPLDTALVPTRLSLSVNNSYNNNNSTSSNQKCHNHNHSHKHFGHFVQF